MIERRANPTPADQIERGNAIIAKYNRRLLWLAGITAALLIALLVFALLKIASVAADAKEAALASAQNTAAIKDLVERQTRADSTRQQLIDDAVAKIAAEQYRALVAHDRRTEELLRRNSRLLNQEVNSPQNQEFRATTMIPRPAPAPGPVAVARVAPAPAGPPTGVAPAPAPAPQPAPCRERGKSGKCKR